MFAASCAVRVESDNYITLSSNPNSFNALCTLSALFFKLDDIKIPVCHKDIRPIIEDDEKMRVFPLFPYDNTRKFEVFTIELEPGCNHQSLPHNEGIEEYIIVTRGQMEVEIGTSIYKLSYGDAVKYFANKPHCYRNKTNETVSFQHIIYYLK